MRTAWTAAGDCQYFQQQLWQNSSFVSLGSPSLALPFPQRLNHPADSPSQMVSFPTQGMEKCYLEDFI